MWAYIIITKNMYIITGQNNGNYHSKQINILTPSISHHISLSLDFKSKRNLEYDIQHTIALVNFHSNTASNQLLGLADAVLCVLKLRTIPQPWKKGTYIFFMLHSDLQR